MCITWKVECLDGRCTGWRTRRAMIPPIAWLDYTRSQPMPCVGTPTGLQSNPVCGWPEQAAICCSFANPLGVFGDPQPHLAPRQASVCSYPDCAKFSYAVSNQLKIRLSKSSREASFLVRVMPYRIVAKPDVAPDSVITRGYRKHRENFTKFLHSLR